ncbi:site-specific integrase [Paraferrimonas sp. SM1919]|uniref:site-specific integrase n=1 Tax=Paraferrimonas sp. SM1919 TaxID=2662263 RepID=UPI0013D3346D|nr:site-specific integrase [Paraferrimonas sp. SM1919]
MAKQSQPAIMSVFTQSQQQLPQASAVYPEEQQLSVAAKELMSHGTSANTRKSYQSAIKQFIAWGGRLPSNKIQILNYISEQSQSLNTRSLDLHLTAISQWHYLQEFSDPVRSPEVKKIMQGLRRVHGKPKQQAKALSVAELKLICGSLDNENLSAIRDRAMILVGFVGAFRRSELTAIDFNDLTFTEEGLLIKIKRSKTDQFSQGSTKAIPYSPFEDLCPVRAMQGWLEHGNIVSGAVFRGINRWQQLSANAISDTSVNQILKNRAKAAGIKDHQLLSGHSLRRGMATESSKVGVEFNLIKKQGGWRSDQTLWQYIDEGKAFTDNAAHLLYQAFK